MKFVEFKIFVRCCNVLGIVEFLNSVLVSLLVGENIVDSEVFSSSVRLYIFVVFAFAIVELLFRDSKASRVVPLFFSLVAVEIIS